MITMTTLRMKFNSTHDLAEHVRQSGDTHWFDRDTLRFFNTRFSSTYYGNGVFVTSERSPSDERRYTVRVLRDNEGRYTVQSVSGFGAYASLNGASNAAQRAAHVLGELYPTDYLSQDELTRVQLCAYVRTEDGWI